MLCVNAGVRYFASSDNHKGAIKTLNHFPLLLPGTLEYTPPEWFLQRQYLAGPTTVWSVGITLYTLVCGLLPFTTIRETIKGRVHFPRGVSPGERTKG